MVDRKKPDESDEAYMSRIILPGYRIVALAWIVGLVMFGFLLVIAYGGHMSGGLHILEDESAPGDMDAQVRVFFDKHEVWLYQGQRDENGRWDQICMTEAQAKALGHLLRENTSHD